MAHSTKSAISRRRLVQAGALACTGLNLPSLLMGEVVSSTDGATEATAQSCIIILQYGGAPQQDSWDLKPDAPEDIRGAFKPISTNVEGMQICEKFPLLAQRADHLALIRSMTTTDGGHDGAMHICMTGKTRPTDQTPYYGSLVSKMLPPPAQLPPYVWIQNLAGDVKPWYLTGGTLGMAHSPLRVGNDLMNPANPEFRFTAFDPPEGSAPQRIVNRYALLNQLDGRRAASAPAADFRQFQEKAYDLVTGTAARAAFDLSQESTSTRDRYGMHPLGQNLLMARRLVQAGVRLVTVVAWTGTPPGEKFRNVQTWDMHGVLYQPDDNLFGKSAYGLSWALPNVDQAVSSLLDDLSNEGLLNSTLVAMVGEFGRTPKVNNRGRDHWPNCYSAMLAGGGIRGGAVYGASDQHAAYVKDKPVTPADFSATLFHALGIPAETRYGPDGFSFRVSDGQPIRELFG